MRFISKRNIKKFLAHSFLRYGPKVSDRSFVLAYHKIVPDRDQQNNIWAYISCKEFEEQIDFLKGQGFIFISLERFLNGLKNKNLPPRSILMTFDDGSADNYQYAFPILKKHRIPAVIFLTAGFIGTDRLFWWDRLESWIGHNVKGVSAQIETFARIEKLIKHGAFDLESLLGGFAALRKRSALNWMEIAEMQAAGISFGAHTVEHVDLARTNDELSFLEIKRSKQMLEAKLTAPVRVFAYPYVEAHNFRKRHFAMLDQLGFEAAFTTVSGAVDPGDDPYCLRRIAVSGSDDLWVFKAKLTSLYPRIADQLKRMEKYVPLPF